MYEDEDLCGVCEEHLDKVWGIVPEKFTTYNRRPSYRKGMLASNNMQKYEVGGNAFWYYLFTCKLS